MREVISGTTGPIFSKFSGLVDLLERLDKSCIYFAITQGTLPWQPILDAKLAKFAYLPYFLHCHSKMD